MKRRKSGIVVMLALIAAAPVIDRDALYRERFAELLRNKGVITSYTPREPILGRMLPLDVATSAQRSISAAALDAAIAYAAANRSSAFIVWRDGRVQAQRYFGVTTRKTLLPSRSLSKPLTAVAVGRAIALGKIASLDQPLADFFPEWRGTPKATMLVRHLLDMRSGLLDQGVCDDPDHPWNRAYIDPDHGRWIVDHYPLTDPPGARYGYNNAAAELVALLIERATGRRYAEFVGSEIFRRIGAPGGEIWIDRPGGLAHSGCCALLPAETWLRLAILLLDDGVSGGKRLLPSGFVADMRKGTPQNPRYGLGVWLAGRYIQRRGFGAAGKPGPQVLHAEPYLDREIFLFDGNADQIVYISPQTRMIVLRMGDAPPASPEWDNSRLPNLLIRGIIPRNGEQMPTPQPR